MRYVHDAGFPVPEVMSVAGADMVMRKIDGPTMLEDAGRRPWTIRAHARTLARLHRMLHRLTPPSWLASTAPGEPVSIVHLDFHPANVIAGPAALNTAHTEILLLVAEIPGGPLTRTTASAGRSIFRRSYRHAYGPLRSDADWLAIAARRRLADPNIRPSEQAKYRAVIAAASGGET